MRIGMLTDVYLPVLNGITNLVELCSDRMRAAGHEVTICTFGRPQVGDEAAGIVRSPGPPLGRTGYHLGYALSPIARRKLATMDVLHTHHPFVSGRLAIRHARRLNKPVVFTNHTRYDLYTDAYLPRPLASWSRPLLRAYMVAFTSRCDTVIVPSPSVRKVLDGLGVRAETRIVPNGIDLQLFSGRQGASSRQGLGIPPESTVLVYCGRLAPEKNIDYLLSAFDRVATGLPDLHLVLVGGGPLESTVRALVSTRPRVHVLGHLPNSAVPGVLAAADAFVTASVTEVHPLSVMEALAAGLPVLGIYSPGLSDIVRPDVDGFLTSPDPVEFSHFLRVMATDAARRRAMAHNARQRSLQFDIGCTVRSLLDLYGMLVERKSARPRFFPSRALRERGWQVLRD